MTQHYSQVRHPVRKIPTKEQVAYAARRQAMQEADPSYSGHSAGIHPEHQPYITDDYELEEDEAYYRTQLPTSARRYQISPEEVYQSGNTRYHVRYVDVPKAKEQTDNSHQHHNRSDIPMKWKQSPKPNDTYIHCCI